jgi:hypothetical protein
MARRLETAVVFVLEDAAPFEDVRRELDPESELRGIPFHVTLLYPFVPRADLTKEACGELRSLFETQAPLEFALTRIETFPAVVYAAPEPTAPLLGCMRALWERFPAWPPYGGEFTEVIPHATLAEGIDEKQAQPLVERRLARHLPRWFRLETATLLEEFAPDRWRERDRLPLGA